MNILLKKIKTPAIVLITSYLIFYLVGYKNLSIGKIINKLHTCQTPIGNSFPCYGVYDIYLMLAMAGVFIVSLLIITVRVILFIRANKKSSKKS